MEPSHGPIPISIPIRYYSLGAVSRLSAWNSIVWPVIMNLWFKCVIMNEPHTPPPPLDATDTTCFEMLIPINMKYEIQFYELLTNGRTCVLSCYEYVHTWQRVHVSEACNVIVIYEGKCLHQYIISAMPLPNKQRTERPHINIYTIFYSEII